MINIYDSLRDENGVVIPGRTKLFVNCTDDTGVIDKYISGVACSPEEGGRMFIVDDWLPGQIDKLLFIGEELVVKDGEELEPPVKSELDLEEEEALKVLEDIQRRRQEKANEPTAEVDKTADEHAKDVGDYLRQSTDT